MLDKPFYRFTWTADEGEKPTIWSKDENERPITQNYLIFEVPDFSMKILLPSNVKDIVLELNFIFEESYEFGIERNSER